MNLVQVENVSKSFGEFRAVDSLSFNIEKRTIYGLLGPNGAGFFLFSTLYAAIGAICNSDEEAQQVTTPVVMLLVIPFMLMFGLFKAPDSTLTIALSHFPFFSPIIMYMRINVLTPPLWEILLNIAAMIITVFVVILIVGKIYKVGILMYGKRPSMGELWKWLRY